MSTPGDVADWVEGLAPEPGSVVTGFDGFVDEILTLVAERQNLENFTPVRDIATFGALISAAAGHSSLREIVVQAVHPGGCAVNLGDGLAALGVPVDCFATFGEPPHPAFAETTRRFRSAHSWGREPGRTLAFEFADGKLMFSAVRQLAELDADDVRTRLACGDFHRCCEVARVIALTDWSLYPHMTGVWDLLRTEVFARLPAAPKFFFDLVDPSSRAAGDILGMLEVLGSFRTCGEVTLGLNGNEANILARLLQLTPAGDEPGDILRLAGELRGLLDIHTVVVHRNRFAVAASSAGRTAVVPGPHCANPRKSTGAGDRFNAGYILGLLGDADLEQCLTLGCATAGFFVRAATSASREDLVDFLRRWSADDISASYPS
jgi:sugar/nucleoside kinase (ribokinase family)